MSNVWIVHIQWPGDEPPMVVSAEGRSPDDALTDCERRGHYFPADGDRVTWIRLIRRRQPQ